MPDYALLAAVALAAYIVGDLIGPVRRAVVTALTSMEKAVKDDVDDRNE